jgi:hypothetical protein
MLGKGLAVGLLCALATLADTSGAAAQVTVRSKLTGLPLQASTLQQAPDGSIVALADDEHTLERVADGKVARVRLPRAAGEPLNGRMTLLRDGGMAFLASGYLGRDPERLVILPPHGRPARIVLLNDSSPSPDWTAKAIAPDGSVWRAKACAGVLSRTTRRGVETRIRLPRMRCSDDAEYLGSKFAFGRDGSVWFASLCQARIVRIARDGARREWRMSRRPRCAADGIDWRPRSEMVATRDGGVRFQGGHITPRGKLVKDGRSLPDAVTPDGAEWRIDVRGVERRGPHGGRRLFTQPNAHGRVVVDWTVGPDGRLWYLAALRKETRGGEVHEGQRVGAFGPTGLEFEQPTKLDESFGVLVPDRRNGVWFSAFTAAEHVTVAAPGS